MTMTDDCYKYIMDLTTNGVVIRDRVESKQKNKITKYSRFE
jgi:hypothetical protein